jgi:hypothetical protein
MGPRPLQKLTHRANKSVTAAGVRPAQGTNGRDFQINDLEQLPSAKRRTPSPFHTVKPIFPDWFTDIGVPYRAVNVPLHDICRASAAINLNADFKTHPVTEAARRSVGPKTIRTPLLFSQRIRNDQ